MEIWCFLLFVPEMFLIIWYIHNLNDVWFAWNKVHQFINLCSILLFVDRVQALIVSPTRELASQTEKVILAIGDFINIQAHACIGGKSVGEDIRKLEHGVHVVSGTPGRVCDMIKRRTLRTRAIKLLVLVINCFYLPMLDCMFFSSLSSCVKDCLIYFSFQIQDESDEMLSRGFKDQIYDVYRYLPPDLQVLFTLMPSSLSLCFEWNFCNLKSYYMLKTN